MNLRRIDKLMISNIGQFNFSIHKRGTGDGALVYDVNGRYSFSKGEYTDVRKLS